MTATASSPPLADSRSPAGGAPAAAVSAAPPFAGALRRMALGRIVLGTLSLAAPGVLARGAGVDATAPLTYMTRIFGARAIALGAGYLTAPAEERRRWQRLALMVDLSDSATGLRQLLARDLPARTALPFVALTGTYAAFGVARAIRDVHSARSSVPTSI